jgi:isopentenyl-diphosphate Delta-isomerase
MPPDSMSTSSAQPSRTVTLVDESGSPVGELDVVAAHTAPGFAHLACSAVVFGPGDTVLMQRRSEDKSTFAGQWSNTCCTHPMPGESPIDAAERRVKEELGISVVLRAAGSFRYRAVDAATAMVEHELDTVCIATVTETYQTAPNHVEVAEARWMPIDEALARTDLTPWCLMVLRLALSARDA